MWCFLKTPPQVERMGLRMALWLSGSFDFGSFLCRILSVYCTDAELERQKAAQKSTHNTQPMLRLLSVPLNVSCIRKSNTEIAGIAACITPL